MGDKFDDFFNEFFGNGKENNDESNEDEKFDKEQNESVEKFINMISESDGNIEDTFGNPDEIEYFEEDNFYFERRIWNTVGGRIIKISMIEPPETPEEFHKFTHGRISDDGFEEMKDYVLDLTHEDEQLFSNGLRESLVLQLDMAVADEEFEEAVRLRDLIKSIDEDELG